MIMVGLLVYTLPCSFMYLIIYVNLRTSFYKYDRILCITLCSVSKNCLCPFPTIQANILLNKESSQHVYWLHREWAAQISNLTLISLDIYRLSHISQYRKQSCNRHISS
jgi:hypothetical protein